MTGIIHNQHITSRESLMETAMERHDDKCDSSWKSYVKFRKLDDKVTIQKLGQWSIFSLTKKFRYV